MGRVGTASRSGSRTSGFPAPSSTGTRFTRTPRSRRSGSPGAARASDSSGSGRGASTNDGRPSSSSTGSSWSGKRGRPGVDFAPNDAQRLLVTTVRQLMDRFGPDYWLGLEDRQAYPEDFVSEFEAQGFGSLLLPEEYGGAGGTLTDAALVLEEIHAAGGNAQPFHGQYYLSFLVSRFASEPIRHQYFPAPPRGDRRIQGSAPPDRAAGSDPTGIT